MIELCSSRGPNSKKMIIEISDKTEFEVLQELRNVCARESGTFKEVSTQTKRLFVCLEPSEYLSTQISDFGASTLVHSIDGQHQLVSKDWKSGQSSIEVGEARIGPRDFALILGPCAIESEQQIAAVVEFLSSQGVKFIRGGAFKPRTSAYSFRGLGLEALKLLSQLARPAGLKVVSEITSQRMIEPMAEIVDVFQVGARNMQNFCLLHELGKAQKPVLLKRALSGKLDELLHSAEHIFASGNEEIVLCERGIRTFESSYRNTLDLNAIPYLKQRSHLPVIVDPSHGTGVAGMVTPLARAAVMAGADGVIAEVHPDPGKALSDGMQSLNFDQAKVLIQQIRSVVACRESLEDL